METVRTVLPLVVGSYGLTLSSYLIYENWKKGKWEKTNGYIENVTAKCYGGDITRRRKLIEKQNEGKKKMFNIGKVKLSPNIFTKLFDLKGN